MPVAPTPAQRVKLWITVAIVVVVAAIWWLMETGQRDLPDFQATFGAGGREPLLQFEPVTGLYLLQTLPIGAAVVVFARMVVGMKSFGLFTPMLMAMAFLQTGPIAGPLILAMAIGAGLIIAPMLKRLKMARVGFLAGLMSIVTAVLIALLPYLGEARWVTAFPVVVTALAVERWWVVWEGEGLWDAFKIAISTILIAIAIELVVLSPVVGWMVATSPFLPAVVGGIGALGCGLYRGLRLSELTRFKAVQREA